MRNRLKGALFFGLMIMIIAGCSNADTNKPNLEQEQGAGNNNEMINENDLSPQPEEEADLVSKTVALYFTDKDLMTMYRVQTKIEADSEADLPEAALKAWMLGTEHDDLTNLVPPEVIIEKIEFKDGIAYVSFSGELRNANLGSSGEMFLIEQIVMIMKEFGYGSTQILVEGEAEESTLGHVTTSEPIDAADPEDYEWYE